MKSKIRDNLIYAAVGIGIAARVVADFFYADSHDRKMWLPSNFAFRAITTPILLAYFFLQETLRLRATLFQMFAAVAFATLVELGILFGFRQIVDRLPGIPFTAFAVREMLFVWQLSVKGAPYLIPSDRQIPD